MSRLRGSGPGRLGGGGTGLRDLGGRATRPGSGLPGGRSARYRHLPPVRPVMGGPGGSRLTGFAPPRRSLRERALAKNSPLRHVDWVLLAVVLALSLAGTLLVWSAVNAQAGGAATTYLLKQLLNVAIGLVLMAGVSMIDSRQLRMYAPFAYLAACLGLLVVLSPLGTTVNGAHSWIALPGGFEIEPSEFAKLGLILITAMVLAEARHRSRRPGPRELALAIGCGVVPLLLVALQPDLGVVIVLLVLLVGIISLSGLRLRWLAGLAAAGVAAGVAAWSMHLLKAYQVQRLTSFINPSADPRGTGYSAAQSKIAIGSGGMFGQGLFHGQLVAGNFVPEQHTDFIFSVAGEELGFAGGAVIIALLAILLVRALRIAARADDLFGLLVAAGIAIWFGIQSFINIGMTIGITPVTGLPLPFVSYGGSAMFADMIAVGVLLSIHRRHRVFG